MKSRICLAALGCILSAFPVIAQVSVTADGSDPDPSSMLDVQSISKGMLVPRMTIAQRDLIASPAKGLFVYSLTNNQFYYNRGTSSSPDWVFFNTQWANNGNSIYYSGGRVGIGIDAPIYTLHVDGSIKVGNVAGDKRKIYFGDGTGVYVGEETTDNRLGLAAASLMININGSAGTAGQVLTSDGTTCTWANPGLGGSGTTDYLARWTTASALGTGKVRDNGTTVAINTAPDSYYMLKVDGNGTTAIQGSYATYTYGRIGGNGYGVFGTCSATGSGNAGVYGQLSGDNAGNAGVIGIDLTMSDGTNYTSAASSSGVKGISHYGYAYNFGVFGCRTDNDDGPSAGVIGLVSSLNATKPWGALGYQAATLEEYAGYFSGNILLTNGIHDGDDFGSTGSVLMSDGTDDVYWSANPGVTGSGTTNYIPKWTGSTMLAASQLYDDGTRVCLGTTTPGAKLTVFANSVYTAVTGSFNSTIKGSLGTSAYGVYGQYDTDRTGYIGGEDYTIYAKRELTGNYAGYFSHSGAPSDYVRQFAINASMTNSLLNDGSGYLFLGENSGGIRSLNSYGARYTFGVAAWNYNDDNRCGGVLGCQANATHWGALGYKDSGSNPYGGYFTSNTTGTGKSTSGPTAEGIGIGAWGGLMGADIHGGVYGIYAEGENFALYTNGAIYADGPVVQLQDGGGRDRTALYSSTSTQMTVMTSGQGRLTDGKCAIAFDEDFRNVISQDMPLVITVTPMGPTNGVYVMTSGINGFSVEENNDGESECMFSYIVIGQRAGYEQPQLAGEVISGTFDTSIRQGLHDDSDTQTEGKGLYYQGGRLVTDMPPATRSGSMANDRVRPEEGPAQ